MRYVNVRTDLYTFDKFGRSLYKDKCVHNRMKKYTAIHEFRKQLDSDFVHLFVGQDVE
jgi:hypothetical protein